VSAEMGAVEVVGSKRIAHFLSTFLLTFLAGIPPFLPYKQLAIILNVKMCVWKFVENMLFVNSNITKQELHIVNSNHENHMKKTKNYKKY
jgi:hypothetical protein